MNTEKIQHQYTDQTRLALLEQSINNINNTLIRFEKRFDKLDVRFDRVDEQLNVIRKESNSDFKWLLTIFGGLIFSLFGIMAHSLHWF